MREHRAFVAAANAHDVGTVLLERGQPDSGCARHQIPVLFDESRQAGTTDLFLAFDDPYEVDRRFRSRSQDCLDGQDRCDDWTLVVVRSAADDYGPQVRE